MGSEPDYVDVGYGIDTCKLKLKDDAAFRLLSTHMPDMIRERYADEMCDGEETFALTEEGAETFASSYVSDYIDYSGGIFPLLTDIINEEHVPAKAAFRFEDCCVYVPARIPQNAEEKNTMLTQEEIREIVTPYIELIADAVPQFETIQICI